MDDSTDDGIVGVADDGFRQDRLDNETRARISTLSEQVTQLRDALLSSRAEQVALREEVQSVRAELQGARSENEALRQSLSWRITRPLRRLNGGS